MQEVTGLPGDIALAVNMAEPVSLSVRTTEPLANEFPGLSVEPGERSLRARHRQDGQHQQRRDPR